MRFKNINVSIRDCNKIKGNHAIVNEQSYFSVLKITVGMLRDVEVNEGAKN